MGTKYEEKFNKEKVQMSKTYMETYSNVIREMQINTRTANRKVDNY